MYLYAEYQNGRRIGSKKIARMDTAFTREWLQAKLPGATILSPLEPAGNAGSIAVIVVYGSRTPDGKARMSPLELWATI